MGTDDVVCVDFGVVGCCYSDCVFGSEVAVLAVRSMYHILITTVVTNACGRSYKRMTRRMNNLNALDYIYTYTRLQNRLYFTIP